MIIDFTYSLFLEELYKSNLSPATIESQAQCAKRILCEVNLKNIEEINNFIIKNCSKNNPDDKTKKRYGSVFCVMRKLIDFTIEDKTLKNSLLKNIIYINRSQNNLKSSITLTPSQILKVLNEMAEKKHKIMGLLMMESGIRIGDCLNIRCDDVYEEKYKEKPCLRIKLLGKGYKQNLVYVTSPLLIEYILDLKSLSTNGYIFITTPKKLKRFRKGMVKLAEIIEKENVVGDFYRIKKINYTKFWIDLKNAVSYAGIPYDKFSCHDFRRCFAKFTWMQYKDVDVLRKLLNHSNGDTTMRYLRSEGLDKIEYQNDLQKAMEMSK